MTFAGNGAEPHALAGRFRPVRRLAHGGLGEVFLALDDSIAGLSREVVVKRLLPNWASEPKTAALFAHEAQLLAAMAHPVIPQVYAHAHDATGPFIAMEFVPGVDLAAVLALGEPMPVPHALTVAVQLLEALAHVHARRDHEGRPLFAVHRDVHPWNVRVASDGHVGLLDFGIAQSAWLPSTRDDARGTPGYVAPEALNAQGVDARADLFAVGVVLWEMLTARRLFDGGALRAMNAICEGGRIAPSQCVAHVPTSLDDEVLRALAIDPNVRHTDARSLLDALERVAMMNGLLLSRSQLGDWIGARAPSAR